MLTKAGVNAAAIKAAFDAAETETALDKACAEAGTRCIRLADVLRRNERCSSATTDWISSEKRWGGQHETARDHHRR